MTLKRVAAADVWDVRHQTILDAGDRNQSEQWLVPFLPLLTGTAATTVLDLGCGTGFEVLELARRGFQVSGIDHSSVAIGESRRLLAAEGLQAELHLGDIAHPLPYRDGAFDAIISNLVLHSFSDAELRAIVAEVRRCLQHGGLFLFHVNSTADLVQRTRHQPPEQQLSVDSFILAGGQTMHFFSEEYCRSLLSAFTVLEVTQVTSCDPGGHILKNAWRCIAQKLV